MTVAVAEIGVIVDGMVNGNCRRWLPEYGYRGRFGDTPRKRQLPELDYWCLFARTSYQPYFSTCGLYLLQCAVGDTPDDEV
jgi:hypothetical protein